MGQDYNARKSAKKRNKRAAREGEGTAAVAGRVRKKKNQPRRLCRCACALLCAVHTRHAAAR